MGARGDSTSALTVVQTAGSGGIPVINNRTYTPTGSVTGDGVATYNYSARASGVHGC